MLNSLRLVCGCKLCSVLVGHYTIALTCAIYYISRSGFDTFRGCAGASLLLTVRQPYVSRPTMMGKERCFASSGHLCVGSVFGMYVSRCLLSPSSATWVPACLSLTALTQGFAINLQDLEPLKGIGAGVSGVVQKVRHRPTGQCLVLKVLLLCCLPRRPSLSYTILPVKMATA